MKKNNLIIEAKDMIIDLQSRTPNLIQIINTIDQQMMISSTDTLLLVAEYFNNILYDSKKPSDNLIKLKKEINVML